jgi:hypothetical protein
MGLKQSKKTSCFQTEVDQEVALEFEKHKIEYEISEEDGFVVIETHNMNFTDTLNDFESVLNDEEDAREISYTPQESNE